MEQGYIVKEHYGIVYLTEKGMKAAESITPWEAASIPLESD
jgi:Mn-dependent DtxR family transcriptional regulator